jgi:hypothetical protein
MKIYWQRGGTPPRILNFDTGLRTVVTFILWKLYFREGAPSTHWIGGCVDYRADMGAVAERNKNPFPDSAGNPTPVVLSSA